MYYNKCYIYFHHQSKLYQPLKANLQNTLHSILVDFACVFTLKSHKGHGSLILIAEIDFSYSTIFFPNLCPLKRSLHVIKIRFEFDTLSAFKEENVMVSTFIIAKCYNKYMVKNESVKASTSKLPTFIDMDLDLPASNLTLAANMFIPLANVIKVLPTPSKDSSTPLFA